jgi:hypothetical protein
MEAIYVGYTWGMLNQSTKQLWLLLTLLLFVLLLLLILSLSLLLPSLCLQTTIAATMFPHLSARLFAARNEAVMQRGMACMNFTFFIVQLSSMITGWVAISALAGSPMAKGTNIFSAVLLRVAERGVGQSVFSALLLASGAARTCSVHGIAWHGMAVAIAVPCVCLP